MNTTDKTLRGTIIFGLVAALFVPFFVSANLFFPFITGKNFAFRIIVELISIAYIVLALRDRNYRPRKSAILFSFSAFMVIIGLADIFGANFFRSFWSNYERMEGYVAMIHYFLYFIILGSVLKTPKAWSIFLNTSIVASTLMAFYALLQVAGKFTINQGGSRADGFFGNATYLAAYMLMHFFITAIFAYRHRVNKKALTTYSIVMLLQLLALYHTATRGAILGLIGGLFIAFVVYGIEAVRTKKVSLKIPLIGLVAIVLFVGGFFAVRNSKFVQDSQVLSRFANISLTEQTTESRFIIWNMSFKGFLERPILGWGQDNYNLVFNKYFDPQLWKQEPWFDRAHNIFFDWLIAGGLLGLIAYLGMFATSLSSVFSHRHEFSSEEKAIFAGFFASYFASNMFVFDNYASYLIFFTVLAYLHSHIVSKGKLVREESNGQNKLAHEVFGALGVVVLVVSLYFVNVKPLLAANTLLNALLPQEKGIIQNLALYQKAIGYKTFGTNEATERLIETASQVNAADQSKVDPAVRKQFIDLARLEISKRTEESPNDARYQVFLGMFLSRIGEQGLPALLKAEELSPGKQSIKLEIANVYAMRGEMQKALDEAKKAYDLAPEFPDAFTAYVSALIGSGKVDEGEKLLATRPEVNFADGQIINAYARSKSFGKLIDIWKKVILKDPSNTQARVALAASYLESGNRAMAISTLEEVIKLTPSFKEQGTYFINEIKAGRKP